MITGLDHIAIAVPDLAKGIERFCKDFGLTLQGTEAVAEAQTETAFLHIDNTQIELIHPIDQQGPVQKYLDKRGGGIHHLCFSTDNIEEDMKTLTAIGYEFIHPTPQPGAHNTLVNFIHPKTTDGILIEIAQKLK